MVRLRHVAPWLLYYGITFAAVGVLFLRTAPAEAHGQGCCIDPCLLPEGCSCPDNRCTTESNIQHYYDPACDLPKKSGVCRAGICWFYTDNSGAGEPCEFLCCNDDFAMCY